MSEADLREGLRAAVGDEPPLEFDADELIRRAQHVRRRRRALVAVAVATLALTGTVLALPGVLDQRRGVDAASGAVLTTTASGSASEVPATTPPPVTTVEPTGVKPPTTAATKPLTGGDSELFEYLRKRFTEVAPDVKVVAADAAATTDSPSRHVYAWLTFVDKVGTSRVVVRVAPPGSGMTQDEFCAEAGCEGPIRQRDGSSVMSSWRTTALPDPEGVMHAVAHFRLDGSVVEVRGFGYQPPVDVAGREKVLLTYDQLASLATDPKLGVS